MQLFVRTDFGWNICLCAIIWLFVSFADNEYSASKERVRAAAASPIHQSTHLVDIVPHPQPVDLETKPDIDEVSKVVSAGHELQGAVKPSADQSKDEELRNLMERL